MTAGGVGASELERESSPMRARFDVRIFSLVVFSFNGLCTPSLVVVVFFLFSPVLSNANDA